MYGQIAKLQSEAGYFAGAQHTISMMEPPGSTEHAVVEALPETIASLAAVQVNSGNIDGAIAWVKRQDADSMKAYIYLGIGNAILNRDVAVDP